LAVGMVTDGWGEESATGNSWGGASAFGERETKGNTHTETERERERDDASFTLRCCMMV